MEGSGAGSMIRRTENGEHECVIDEVAIEEPLEIRIAGEAVATTMRTPGNDEELAAGFLLSEGIVHTRGELRAISRSEEHTSELQSLAYLVCRLLLEKKKKLRCILRLAAYCVAR